MVHYNGAGCPFRSLLSQSTDCAVAGSSPWLLAPRYDYTFSWGLVVVISAFLGLICYDQGYFSGYCFEVLLGIVLVSFWVFF